VKLAQGLLSRSQEACLFPDPRALVPAPRETVFLKLHNKPTGGGKLSGRLFTDGSCLEPKVRRCTAPRWLGGGHDRQDGQRHRCCLRLCAQLRLPRPAGPWWGDYALLMAVILSEGALDLFVDCQGSMDAFELPRSESTGAGNPRAHLWRIFWKTGKDRTLLAREVKAHATERDVLEGRTTWW